ncbi:MAG: hypothetical protein ACI4PT_06150 [Candidatus Avoscillospira sp.]
MLIKSSRAGIWQTGSSVSKSIIFVTKLSYIPWKSLQISYKTKSMSIQLEKALAKAGRVW